MQRHTDAYNIHIYTSYISPTIVSRARASNAQSESIHPYEYDSASYTHNTNLKIYNVLCIFCNASTHLT